MTREAIIAKIGSIAEEVFNVRYVLEPLAKLSSSKVVQRIKRD